MKIGCACLLPDHVQHAAHLLVQAACKVPDGTQEPYLWWAWETAKAIESGAAVGVFVGGNLVSVLLAKVTAGPVFVVLGEASRWPADLRDTLAAYAASYVASRFGGKLVREHVVTSIQHDIIEPAAA